MLALSPGPVFFLRREDESLGDLLMALGGSKLAAGAGDMESALRGADRLDAIELLWEVEEALRDRGY
jgi:hypothetical protein